MILSASLKIGLVGLIFFVSSIAGTLHADSARQTSDIVYSARYYKPGARHSHYKIWRIDSSGSGRMQVTSGSTEDRSPIWLADGKTILFVRKRAKTSKLCTVGASGGRVRELAALPKGYVSIESVAPNRRSVVYLVHDSKWKLVLFDMATRKEFTLGAGNTTAWSPDSRRLYISPWGESKQSAQILDLRTRRRQLLKGNFGAGAWLNGQTLAAEEVAKDQEQTRLAILNVDGTKKREVLLPFTWNDEADDLSPFADNLFAIPGDPESVLYGRHAGNSTEGPAQVFHRVSLKGGQPALVAKGRNLAWSSDHKLFATGEGRDLTHLDRKRRVWTSPLCVVSFPNGKVRTLVQRLVSVEEFDWRLPAKKALKPSKGKRPEERTSALQGMDKKRWLCLY